MAAPQLTPDEVTFGRVLSKQTGLNPNVVAAWILAEGGSTTGGKFNFLNIGNTDSGARNKAAVWNTNPTSAAIVTAQWLKGTSTAGYEPASAGIRAILNSAGSGSDLSTIEKQIKAIQTSGWASSGYPNLGSLVSEVSTHGGLAHPGQSTPSGFLNDPLGTAADATGIPQAADTAEGLAGDVSTFVGDVTNANLWIRLAQVLGGGILIMIGVVQLAGGRAPGPIGRLA